MSFYSRNKIDKDSKTKDYLEKKINNCDNTIKFSDLDKHDKKSKPTNENGIFNECIFLESEVDELKKSLINKASKSNNKISINDLDDTDNGLKPTTVKIYGNQPSLERLRSMDKDEKNKMITI